MPIRSAGACARKRDAKSIGNAVRALNEWKRGRPALLAAVLRDIDRLGYEFTLKIDESVAAGSSQTIEQIYTVGARPIERGGVIMVARQLQSDAGRMQSGDPDADHCVSAETSNLHVRPVKTTTCVSIVGRSIKLLAFSRGKDDISGIIIPVFGALKENLQWKRSTNRDLQNALTLSPRKKPAEPPTRLRSLPISSHGRLSGLPENSPPTDRSVSSILRSDMENYSSAYLSAWPAGRLGTTIEVCGFETDCKALSIAATRIEQQFPNTLLRFEPDNFLEFVLENFGDEGRGSLFHSVVPQTYDLIIANPPYVRTQIMGPYSRGFWLSSSACPVV